MGKCCFEIYLWRRFCDLFNEYPFRRAPAFVIPKGAVRSKASEPGGIPTVERTVPFGMTKAVGQKMRSQHSAVESPGESVKKQFEYMKKLALPVLLGISLLWGCSKSMLYSPSLNLSNKPLKEKELDLQGGVELMPEARTEILGGNKTTLGVSGQVGYGFSDKFSLGVKGWIDAQGREDAARFGVALQGVVTRMTGPAKRLLLVPRIGLAFWGDQITGYGLGASAVFQKELSDQTAWHFGAGFAWGFRYLNEDINAAGENKIPMGLGLLGHIGFAWEFAPGLRLSVEATPLYQINTFDKNQQFIVSPQLGLGYTFRREN